MENINYNKIYARANADGKVTHIFSEAFETPQETDVCIDETNTARHGAQKYEVFDEEGLCNYEIRDGALAQRDKTAEREERRREEIRQRRETECFLVTDRGVFWYEKLSVQQRNELSAWYQAWLDAPQTGEIPQKPLWLK